MTKILIYKCDRSDCKKQIDLAVYAGTWIEVSFPIGLQPSERQIKHFCGFYCLNLFTEAILSNPYVKY